MIDDAPKGSGLKNILSLPHAVMKGLFPDGDASTSHQEAAWIGVLTIAAMVLWSLFASKRVRLLPAVLVGVAVATAASVWFDLPIKHIAMQDDLFAVVHIPPWEALSHLLDTSVLAEALGLAFIASVETLLSASAVDRCTRGLGRSTTVNARARCRQLVMRAVGRAADDGGDRPQLGQRGGRRPHTGVCHSARSVAPSFVSALPFVFGSFRPRVWVQCLVFTGYKLMNFNVCVNSGRMGVVRWLFSLRRWGRCVW